MIKEFEGKTENEAIDNAAKTLGIDRENLEIEHIENKKGLFFMAGKVIVKVRVDDPIEISKGGPEDRAIGFVKEVLKRMKIEGNIKIKEKEDTRAILDIESKDSAILIGKQGKNLDALQLLSNIVAGKNLEEHVSFKIVIDVENYRSRREKSLIHFAKKVAEKVQRTRSSMLLEPMNPFERRLVHTTLNKSRNIETVSEGDGLYKKIRVLYRRNNRR